MVVNWLIYKTISFRKSENINWKQKRKNIIFTSLIGEKIHNLLFDKNH